MTRKITISKLLKIKIYDRDLYLIYNGIYKIAALSAAQIEFLSRLKAGIDENLIMKEIENRENEELYKIFLNNGWITFETDALPTWATNDFNPKTMGYLSAFVNSPIEAMDKIGAATVCIVGLGGVGSVVLENLVASDVRNFILVDYDKVSSSNLNRQYIYARSNLGESKVEAARRYILERNPQANVSCFENKIDHGTKVEYLKEYKIDIMIGAADFPKNIDAILSKFCSKNNIPFICGSVAIETGGWGPLIVPGITRDMETYFDKKLQDLLPVEQDLSDEERVVEYSFGPTNSIISTFLARDIIMFLMGAKNIPSLGKRMEIDLINMRLSETI